MPSQWLIYRGGTHSGPFTSQQLRAMASSGQIAANDLIWKQGMAEWVQASSAKGLFSTASQKPSASPERAPESEASVPPVSTVSLMSRLDVLRKACLDSRLTGSIVTQPAVRPCLIGAALGIGYAMCFGSVLLNGVLGLAIAAIISLGAAPQLRAIQLAASPLRFGLAILVSLLLVGGARGLLNGSPSPSGQSSSGYGASFWGRPKRSSRADFVRRVEALVLSQAGMARVESVSPPVFDMHGNCLASFIEEFGEPDKDVQDRESSVMRYWVYNCTDGPVLIRLTRMGMGFPSDKTRPFRLLSKRDYY
jgi:hypothetical protein